MSALVLFEKDNMDRLVKAANMLCKSALCPNQLKGKVEDTFAVLCWGAELGLSPMVSLNTIHPINGRPTMAGQLMVGLVRKAVPGAYIKFEVDREKEIVKCFAARSAEEKDDAYCAQWDMARIKQMGLATKDNYLKQPVTMMTWRAAAEAMRVVFSDILLGLYATEELQDLDGKELVQVKNFADDDHLDRRTDDQKELGNPEYIIGHAKLRGKALKDLSSEELESYLDTLEERASKQALKTWESEVLTSIRLYLANIENAPLEVPPVITTQEVNW